MTDGKIRAAIVEDEKPAARLLRDMIASLRPEWEIDILPGNITGAVKWFAAHEHPDILFLDIQLSDGDSFLFIEQAAPRSLIVFTTAYDEYALRAFSVNSIDYLLKPIHQERLQETVLKYETLASRGRTYDRETLLETLRSLADPAKRYRTRFLINGASGSYALRVEDTAFFYVEGGITFAMTHDGKEHIVDFTLDRLSEQLDPDRFFRANRQTLVSVDAVVRIEPYFQNRIVVRTKPEAKERIVVSREKAAAFKLWLDW